MDNVELTVNKPAAQYLDYHEAQQLHLEILYALQNSNNDHVTINMRNAPFFNHMIYGVVFGQLLEYHSQEWLDEHLIVLNMFKNSSYLAAMEESAKFYAARKAKEASIPPASKVYSFSICHLRLAEHWYGLLTGITMQSTQWAGADFTFSSEWQKLGYTIWTMDYVSPDGLKGQISLPYFCFALKV